MEFIIGMPRVNTPPAWAWIADRVVEFAHKGSTPESQADTSKDIKLNILEVNLPPTVKEYPNGGHKQ